MIEEIPKISGLPRKSQEKVVPIRVAVKSDNYDFERKLDDALNKALRELEDSED